MKKELRILLVDDHPIIIEGYKNALVAHYRKEYELHTDVAHNCEDASIFIKRAKEEPYDIGLIDINLPPSPDGQLNSGEDVAQFMKKHHEDSKVIVLTMHDETSRLHHILEHVNPEGFLIKSDLSSAELVLAFEQVLHGKTYYSSAVNVHLRKMVLNDIRLDKKNLQILYHLSRGVRTKNLGEHVNLSLSAIEKRKTYLKELFDMKSADDEQLIGEARKRGFI